MMKSCKQFRPIICMVLGMVATLAVSCTPKVDNASTASSSPVDRETVVTPSDNVSEADQSASQGTGEVIQSGAFVAAEHSTNGTARIVAENGKRYLEFDQAFQTDRGPDLFVLLHQQGIPESYSEQEYVNLGELQQVNGAQRYEIPEDVDPTQFQSAVIWCRQFNVTFGYATFGG